MCERSFIGIDSMRGLICEREIAKWSPYLVHSVACIAPVPQVSAMHRMALQALNAEEVSAHCDQRDIFHKSEQQHYPCNL
jgi:hypothetical protein